VARLIERIRRLLDHGGTGISEEIDRLATELEAHLDYEEDQLVPILNKMLTLPEEV
jgi:hypothetical protein